MFPRDDHPPVPDPRQVIDAEREARVLRRDFSGYRIDLDYTPAGARYTARRQSPGPGPWLVMTTDPIGLRTELPGTSVPYQR